MKSCAFINTRPQGRNHQILQAFQSQTSISEYALPLLELQVKPLDERVREQLLALNLADVIVVVSPIAVDIAMQYLIDLGISINPKVQWIAVGQATAERLQHYHITVEVPQLESSEGMWQLPALQKQSLQRVAFLRGEGGREWLMQQLINQDVQVDNILLYTRRCPDDIREQWQAIKSQLHTVNKIFVLISSGASWTHWQALRKDYSGEICYLVLGERVYQWVLQDLVEHEQVERLDNLKHSEIASKISLHI